MNGGKGDKQSRSKAVFQGITVDFGGNALQVLASIVVTPLILTYLSSSTYGFWMTVLQAVGLLGVLEMGAGVALIQKGADPRVVQDRERFDRLFNACLAIQLATAVIWLFLGLVLKDQVFEWFKINEREVGGASFAFTLMVVWLALWNILGLPAILLVMRQKMAIANGISSAVQILSTIGVVPLLAAGSGVIAFPVAQSIFGFAGAVVAYRMVRLHLPPLRIRIAELSGTDIREIMGFSLYNWLNKISYVILTASDNILIAATLGPASVTPYILTTRLSSLIGPNMAKISSSAFAGFSELHATKSFDRDNLLRLRGAALGLCKFSLRVACFGSVLVMTCTQRFVDLWVGHSHFAGSAFVLLLGCLCFRDTIVKGISVIIMASGEIRGLGAISIIEAVAKIGLVLMFILGFGMGLSGVVLGQLLATLFLSAFYFPKKICGIAEIDGATLFRSGFLNVLLRSLPSMVVLLLLSRIVPESWGWGGLALTVAAGVVVNMLCFELPRFLCSGHAGLSFWQRVIWSFRSNYI